MKKLSNYMWGVILILTGFCYAGNAFGWWHFSFWPWWPLLILVPCLVGIITEGPRVGNVIGVILGFVFLPVVRDLIDFQILRSLIVPIVLIIIGLSIIFKDCFHRKFQPKNINIGTGNGNAGEFQGNKTGYEYNATFSSQNVMFPNNVFPGATANAVFGGVELDLRNAIITEDVVIDCSAVFGGIDIFVPVNVMVKVSSTPIFGGVSNKNCNLADPNAPVVYVNATCLFGGVDIK